MRQSCFLILYILSCTVALAASIQGRASVIDGNRILIGSTVIGLSGIDAPESNQRCELGNGTKWFCGRAAAVVLMELAQEKILHCETDDMPQQSIPEIRARCRIGDEDVGAALVRRGMAWATPDAPTAYLNIESTARAKKIGIFQAPTERANAFRARRWREAAKSAPNQCPVKGNIDLIGRRIYHLPWSQWYALTKVSTDQGEQWFCNERQAIRAGWQHAAWNFVPRLDPDDMPEGGVLRNQR